MDNNFGENVVLSIPLWHCPDHTDYRPTHLHVVTDCPTTATSMTCTCDMEGSLRSQQFVPGRISGQRHLGWVRSRPPIQAVSPLCRTWTLLHIVRQRMLMLCGDKAVMNFDIILNVLLTLIMNVLYRH